jgi:DAK2 domain fusion protein YloV
MKIINGHQLKQMIISGANNLFNCYPEIDALNVFPVPDGDTGTNMNLTMTSGSKEVKNIDTPNIYEVARTFSRGLLMGARGNSGVILSQIFRGFAMGLEGKKEANCYDFADALISAKDVAYKAVMKPVEGTILTVIRESSVALKNYVDGLEKPISIKECMEYLREEAQKSLERTPELLPVLKEVGVVDSGGAGLIKVFDGFVSSLNNKMIERAQATVEQNETPIVATNAQSKIENSEFGYCTEFIMQLSPEKEGKKNFAPSRFKSVLENHGNSIVVVQDDDIVKVHIHTMKPGNIFNYAQQFGEFVTLKVENMQLQHSNITEKESETKEVEVVKQEKKKYGIISVSVGEGLNQIFKDLRVDEIVSGGQTMNPSTEDFVEAINRLNAENVFILPNNSNIVMAANQASQVVEGVNCKVIPTKTIPQGMVACMMFNPYGECEENFEQMCEAIGGIKTGQVTFAIKDTNINGIEIKENHFMGLNGKEIITCKEDRVDATITLLESMIDDDSEIVTLIAGEDAVEQETDKIVSFLTEKYPVEVDVKIGMQPVYSYIIGVE